MSGTQSNETVTEELPQESDGVTSCMWGCTILHKPGHAELVWGDLLGEIIMELLKHRAVVLRVDRHRHCCPCSGCALYPCAQNVSHYVEWHNLWVYHVF